MKTRLTPPATKGHTSVARVTDDWYVVCRSDEVSDAPLAVTLMGTPLVVFRGEGGAPGALLDRCPHRNAPLSLGRVEGGTLECGYHGWRFDGGGTCRRVPGLLDEHEKTGRNVPVYGTPDTEPVREPFRFPHIDDARYTTVRQELVMEGSVHATAENALDVPHTAYLHRGLFRGNREPREIEAVVRRWHDRAEAEYIGEPAPAGLVGKFLAPSSGIVQHWDRFILPSIAQVEYRLEESHLVISNALTPIDDFTTKMFAAVTFKLPVPGFLVAGPLKPVILRILKQDAVMLERQTDVIRRFGGEQFVSTPLDTLGPHILRLLRNAEDGNRTPVKEPQVRRTKMLV